MSADDEQWRRPVPFHVCIGFFVAAIGLTWFVAQWSTVESNETGVQSLDMGIVRRQGDRIAKLEALMLLQQQQLSQLSVTAQQPTFLEKPETTTLQTLPAIPAAAPSSAPILLGQQDAVATERERETRERDPPPTPPSHPGPRQGVADTAAHIKRDNNGLLSDIVFAFQDKTSVHYIKFSSEQSSEPASSESSGMLLVTNLRKLRSFIRGSNLDQYCRINSEDAGIYNGLAIQKKGHIQCSNSIDKATVFNVEITGSSSVSIHATTDDGSEYYCDNPEGSIDRRYPVVCKAETEKFQFKLSQYSHKENNMVC